MKLARCVLVIAAMACTGVVVPRTAAADDWNRETILTFNHDVAIPGTVLPAGTYVFRLADVTANRHVVQVFDHSGRILATVLTIPAIRATPADDISITFDERPAGAPVPIKQWFYPGDGTGEEFLYFQHSS